MAYLKTTLLLLLLCFFASCEPEDPEDPSLSEMLAGTDVRKGWKITSIESIGIGTKGPPRACVEDNLIFYYVDGRYVVSEGQNLCNASDQQSIEGTWALINDEFIRVEIGDSLQIWTIESLNNQQKELSSNFIEGSRIYSLTSSN
ncbi:MAG: hypothetical protein AAF616_11620 [Bacteroidota bacterium]